MTRMQAAIKLDDNRAPEQRAFLAERVEVLREAGGQLWVALEDSQLDALLAQGLVVTPVPDADVVELPALALRPASETAELPDGLAAAEPAGDATADHLVQFRAPPDKDWLRDLALAGGELLHALPPTAAVVRMTGEQAAAVRALGHVASVGLFHPAYAVSVSLAGAAEPFTASSLRTLTVRVPPDDPDGNLTLRWFDAIDPEDRRGELEAAGATIVAPAPHGFRIRAPQARIVDILRVRGLYAAELPTRTQLTNNHSGVILGTNQIRAIGAVNFLVNLDGRGEIGGLVDSGCDVGNLAGAPVPPAGVMTPFHPDLAANVRLIRNSANPQNPALGAPDAAPHGTHVAGTICGDGTSSAGQVRGMAPGAALVALGPLPGDFRVPFEFAFQSGARAINNSWETSFGGAPVTSNRYLPAFAEAVDRWCFEHPDVLIVFAAGNDESDTLAGGDGVLDSRTLGLEQAAKNALVVGASENLRNNGGWRDSYRAFFGPRYNHAAFNATAGTPAGAFGMSDSHNDIALFSNRGVVRTATMAVTNRVRPDITAPGTNVLSLRSQFVAAPPALPPPPIPGAFYNPNFDSMLPAGLGRNLYQIFHGTSMATPMVTGSALLLRQYYRTRFAQLRRPLLLDGAVIPAAPPAPVFPSLPAVAPHADGLVMVWCPPAVPAAQHDLVAMRVSRALAPVDASPVRLQANIGDHAAPRVATHGDRTYLLHRHGDSTMRLSCYDRALQPVAGFGTAGVVTLAPVSRADDRVAPDLLVVGDHLACVFPTGTDGYFFQRFRADTGAPVDGAALNLLLHRDAGPHATLAHAGPRYTVCGVAHPGNYRLQVRQLGDDGALVGAGPITLVDQPQEIREPCVIADPRQGRYALVWCDARSVAGGEVFLLFLDPNGAAIGAPRVVISVPAANHVRRPRILVHPQVGYLLLWEDDTQNQHHDVYAALLDDTGQVDGRIAPDPSDPLNRRVVRISDTPDHTAGFAALADPRGLSLIYQSTDEINSDRLGVYAVNLTAAAAFEAQEDPLTPLVKSGRYTTALLASFPSGPEVIAAAWTGGAYYVLRMAPSPGFVGQLEWVRLTADGLVDTAFGAAGARGVQVTAALTGVSLLWTGRLLLTVVNDVFGGVTVHMADDQGAPVAAFGTGGAAALRDTAGLQPGLAPQIGFAPAAAQVVVAYGTLDAGVSRLRYQRLDNQGRRVGNPVNLTDATGAAAHGWFQFVPSENRSIAVYHRTVGAVTRVHCRQFQLDGTPQGGEHALSAAAGEAIHASIARRPTAVNSANREYAAVWQFRANNAASWEIRFSRLDRTGTPLAQPPAPAPPLAVADVAVIATGPDWPAGRDAIEPQIVSTYTHSAWANPPNPLPAGTSLPAWSPSYGLAFIGRMPDGARALFFTVLDENGRRAPIPQPPPAAGALSPPGPAPLLALTPLTARVRAFQLVWNGRIFLLSWQEDDGGQIKFRCAAVNRHAGQLVYDLPSAALLRATLINGATNIAASSLPDVTTGCGWGRLNLRQTLSPAPPVTMQVRDDCAVGPGRTASYRFTLPPGTALLRVTLNWTDPPGPRLVNPLHLTVRAPAAGPNPRPEFRGNLWNPAAGSTHLSRPIANPPVAADNHENTHTFKQVVIANPPPGIYDVEVSAAPFPAHAFNQQDLQPFALVFTGSGPEVVFNQPVANVQAAAVY